MAFQLVKHKMAGTCHLFELIYGRQFSKAELSSQPVKEICTQCLLLDNELEQEFMRQKEMEHKSKNKGGGLVLGTPGISQMLFEHKHPEEAKAIVTLLTLKEYQEEIAEPTDIDRNIFGEDTPRPSR
jgi:hypothetical protein